MHKQLILFIGIILTHLSCPMYRPRTGQPAHRQPYTRVTAVPQQRIFGKSGNIISITTESQEAKETRLRKEAEQNLKANQLFLEIAKLSPVQRIRFINEHERALANFASGGNYKICQGGWSSYHDRTFKISNEEITQLEQHYRILLKATLRYFKCLEHPKEITM